MPTAERSSPPADICCWALSRIRCIDGAFIMPAAPRIVSVSGFVCRPSARFSCVMAVARCCSVKPVAPSAARNSAAIGWTTLSSARLARSSSSVSARAASGSNAQQAAATIVRTMAATLLVEIVQVRQRPWAAFLDPVQIRYRWPRLEQRRFLVAVRKLERRGRNVAFLDVDGLDRRRRLSAAAGRRPRRRRTCGRPSARRGRRVRPWRPCWSSCSAR